MNKILIKAVTHDFGTTEVKIKKKFEHKGIQYAICEIPYKYLNREDVSYSNKCVHYASGWQIPVFNNTSKTIKGLIEKSKEVLDSIFKDLGEEAFNKEIKSKEILNKTL